MTFCTRSYTDSRRVIWLALLLHVENVLKLSVEVSAPKLRVVLQIHQFRLDNKSVAPLNHLPCENGAHV